MSSKRHILIFIDWYLPGYKAGGPIRSCANLIAHLKEDFSFSVVTRDSDYMTDVPYLNIKSNEWNILSDGTRVFYFSENQLTKKNIYLILENEVYDTVYLNGIFSKTFTIFPLLYFKNKKNIKVIVATRGMLAESALAIKSWKKNIFLFLAKQFMLFKNAFFHATNETEAETIRAVFGVKASIAIASNFPDKKQLTDWLQKEKNISTLKLVCVARIAPEKNIKYALSILKEVKATIAFDIYGPTYDEAYYKECQTIINEMPSNISVTLKGSIDHSMIADTISKYDFLFLPTRGENFGHVILQSLVVGVPVIISDKTIWRNLKAANAGWDIDLNHSKEFVAVLEHCAKMPNEEYALFSKGAFDFANSYVNDKSHLLQNKQLFDK